MNEETRKKIVPVRFTDAEYQRVKIEANREGRSVSGYLRFLHNENVAAIDSGTPQQVTGDFAPLE